MEHQSDVMPLLNETTTRSRSRSRRSFADIMRHDEMMRKIQGANEVDRRRSGALTNFDRREHRQLDDGGRSAGPASPPPARPRYYPRPPSHPPIAAATDNVQPATLSINPAEASDVTVHLSLDVHENLENTLEEMSRLRRLGHFKKALSLAEVEVKPFLRNRYVLVQYAQLLMDAGRYKDIARLSVDHVPVKHPPNAIELNWTMICQWVEVTTELDITGCTGVLRSGYKSGPLTSTDVGRCSGKESLSPSANKANYHSTLIARGDFTLNPRNSYGRPTFT